MGPNRSRIGRKEKTALEFSLKVTIFWSEFVVMQNALEAKSTRYLFMKNNPNCPSLITS